MINKRRCETEKEACISLFFIVCVLIEQNEDNLPIAFFIFGTFLGKDCLLFTPEMPI